MATTKENTADGQAREDGHTVGCNGFGVISFDLTATTRGLRITGYHYCRIPVRQHHYIPTTEGTDTCL